ncbi:hypothetical protein [Zooshikella sp. RANM57]|uniref:hypothetical protein n=1 Tax=Zooshikella sp. RANM57 TaxID=3425863 RepID=UPI003D6F0522
MNTRYFNNLLILAFVGADGFTQELPVVVGQTYPQLFPSNYQRVVNVLEAIPYKITITILPDKRALVAANSGDYALLLHRQPSITKIYKDLVKLEIKVNELTLHMVTAKETKYLCSMPEKSLYSLTVVGVIGNQFFEDLVYPKFTQYFDAQNAESAIQMIVRGRAQISYGLPHYIPKHLLEKMVFCPDHKLTLSFYNFLHKDYIWAKDTLEMAYQKSFRK